MYTYSKHDPRVSERHYMYAPYEGEVLLRSWTQARDELLDRFSGYEPIPPDMPIGENKTGGNVLRTEARLAWCASQVYRNAHENCLRDVKFFARKMDLARQLRSEYRDGRKSTDEDAGPRSYIFLHYCCTRFATASYGTASGLQLLNAALKAGDVVDSLGWEIIPPDVGGLLVDSLQRERQLVTALANSLGVRLPLV